MKPLRNKPTLDLLPTTAPVRSVYGRCTTRTPTTTCDECTYMHQWSPPTYYIGRTSVREVYSLQTRTYVSMELLQNTQTIVPLCHVLLLYAIVIFLNTHTVLCSQRSSTNHPVLKSLD